MNVSKPCILVVDDEVFIRALLTRRLERKGYKVLHCGNTHDAGVMIKAEKPDVVISDILMPGGDGISFCRRLHAEGNRTPFLFMTTQAQSEVEGLSAGADCYLSKPVDLDLLEARIVALLP